MASGRCTPADRQWWTATVEMCLPAIYRFVRARVPARAVDDIVQDVFVSGARNLHQFAGDEGSVWPWLLSIARHTIAGYYRRTRTRNAVEEALTGCAANADLIQQALVSESALPDAICQRREFRLLVQAALSRLEPRHQACLIARYHRDLSLEEIGQLMDLSRAAVNSLLHRARGQLRQMLLSMVRNKTDFEEFGA